MEIHKQNLVTFTLQEDRLQYNFAVIQTTLKSLQLQIELMQKQQQSVITNMTQNQHKIENLFGVTTKHTNQIHTQKIFIDQLNSQLNSFGSIGFEEPASVTVTKKQDQAQNNEEKQEKEIKGVTVQKSQKRQSNLTNKPVQKDAKKVNEGRNLFQKALSNIKERLLVLQKDSQQKDQTLSEINKYIKQKRSKENEFHQRRVSKDLASKQNSNQKNEIRLMAQIQQSKEKDQSKIDSLKTINKIDMTEGIDSQQNFPSAQSLTPQIQDILSKQIEKIKSLFQQKMRILDLHLKQNQTKIQNIEKNIDILERSHDLLKYDFERSSTSWSKHRPNNQTQDTKHRHGDQRLNDTRITQKEYYEEKLVQLFNQMDVLKGEYLQIHNKIDKEDSELPLLGNDSRQNLKGRIGQKLAHSKEESEEISKKQLLNCRRDLKKLRQQFDEFANSVNTGSNESKTYVIKPNQNKQDWKSLSTKIYKLKMELQAGVRELQGKIVTNNDMVVVLNQLQVGIEECRLLIKKKVETSDFQKAIKRVEGRLNNFILQVFQKQNKANQVDATITKQPWFCLSCDTELNNYTGKLQKSSSPAQKLMGRKVNPELHMVRRNQNSRLPSVLKSSN